MSMTVIRTTDDLLKALREHPEWKEAVRIEILGEELLSLPDLVKENSRQIAENSRLIAENSRQIAENSRKIAELGERIDQLTEIMRQHELRLARVEDRLSSVVGDITEEKYRRTFASRVRKVESGTLRIDTVLSPEELSKAVDNASAKSMISEDEADELAVADVVAFGHISTTGEEVTVVAEISNTLHIHDVLRAIERANIAAKAVSNRRAIPVVMGPNSNALTHMDHPDVWLVENHSARQLIT